MGIGCRRGTSAEQIEQLVDKILKESHINKKSIGRIASIDLKKDEEGLLTFCNKYNIEPEFYPAEELKKVEGEFSVSTFVKKVIMYVKEVLYIQVVHCGSENRQKMV